MEIEVRRGLAEARMLARAHRGALAAYIAIGVVVPFLLLSSEPIFNLRAILALLADPYTYRVSGSITVPLYLLGIVAVLGCGAMLAAWNALLAEFREGYISEIMYGMVAGAAYLVANLIFYFGVGMILSIPTYVLGGPQAVEAYGTAFIVARQIVLTLAGAWLAARFCLVGPIMAAQGKLEPVSAFVASWRRTAASQSRLFGLYFAINIIVAVATLALLAPHVFIVFNLPQDSFAEMAMSGAWVMFWAAYFAIIVLVPAGLYRASQPGGSAEIFA